MFRALEVERAALVGRPDRHRDHAAGRRHLSQGRRVGHLGKVIEQSPVTIPAVWILFGFAIGAVGATPALRVIAWLGLFVLLFLAVGFVGFRRRDLI